MAFRAYSSWRPDACGLNTMDAGEALGVLPRPNGYGPWPGLAATSVALAAACRGAFTARRSNGLYVVFAGTATKLYKFAGVGDAWTDVTRAAGGDYSTPSDGFWSFAQFDNILIACNGIDAVQYIDVDDTSSPAFAALGGSPPVAKYVQVVGDHVMLFDLATAQGPAASTGRIQFCWSGIRDYDFWTFGEKSSSFGTLFSGGFVMGGTPLLGGLVFQQNAINRIVKDPYKIFDAAPILQAQGTESPYSIVSHESATSYLSTDGFMQVVIGGGVRPIGNDWIDNWFRETSDPTRINEVVGAIDPVKMRVYWAFATPAVGDSNHDHIICFDMLNQERPWSHAAFNTEYLFASATAGLTLTSLAAIYATLAAVPYPFGSRVWAGGAPGLAAFDTDHKWAFFAGTPVRATVQTARFQPIPGKRSFVSGFRPIDDAATGTGRVGGAERPMDAVVWGSSESLETNGIIPARTSGRYVKFERVIPAGTEWGDNELKGIEFDGDMIVEDGEQ